MKKNTETFYKIILLSLISLSFTSCSNSSNNKKMSEEEWNNYITSLSDINKLAHVEATYTYKGYTIDKSTSEEEVFETSGGTYLVDNDSSLIYEEVHQSLFDDDLETLYFQEEYVYLDETSYRYTNKNNTFFKKISLGENIDKIEEYQSYLCLATIVGSSYNNLTYNEETNSYFEIGSYNKIEYEYTFKDNELYSISLHYEVDNEDKLGIEESLYVYDFNSSNRVSLPSEDSEGEKISKSDYEKFISFLIPDKYLNNFKVEYNATVNLIDEDSNNNYEIKDEFIGDASNYLAKYHYFEEKNNEYIENGETKKYDDIDEVTTYYYFPVNSSNLSYKTSIDNTKENASYTPLSIYSKKEGAMFSLFKDYLEIDELLTDISYEELNYNEIYKAYNIDDSSYPYLYYFKENKLYALKDIEADIYSDSKRYYNGLITYDFNYNESLSLPEEVDTSILNN